MWLKKSTQTVLSTVHPATQQGMGAIPYAGGTAFRVWAPHAERVFVVGTFNNWSSEAHPLAHEDHGYWSCDIPFVQVGEHYRYRIVTGQQEIYRIDPYAREVTHSAGNAVVYNPKLDAFSPITLSRDFLIANWNELVIYELHIGTFNRHQADRSGTFDSAIERLPFLRDLGINAIEIMPPMAFPGGLSWGYNPAHPFAIDSDYGGPQSFKRFIQAAHDQNIAVLLDVVYNHFGPSDLDLWQFDGWHEHNMGGIYFYQDARAHTPWGHTRLDYGRVEVRQYLRDNALMWLEEYHIDGLRFDATAYIRAIHGYDNAEDSLPEGWSLMQWIINEIHAHQPWKITIAEDLQNNAAVTEQTDRGGAGFDTQWDTNFVHPIRSALTAIRDEDRDMASVANAVSYRYNNNAFRRVIYTESHDEVANGHERVPEEIAPHDADNWFAQKRSTLGAALVLTSPGIPMLFQGQEFLTDEWFDDRRPLDWSRTKQYAGLVELYRDLIALRRNITTSKFSRITRLRNMLLNRQNLQSTYRIATGSTRGLTGQHLEILHINQSMNMLAFHRWYSGGPDDSVLVIANFSSKEHLAYILDLPQAGTWKLRFNSDSKRYSPNFTDIGQPEITGTPSRHHVGKVEGTLDIGPYSVLIYSLIN